MHLLSREEREFVFPYICVFRWWRWVGAYPENIHRRFSLRKTIFQGRCFAFCIFIFFVLMYPVFLYLNFLVNIFLHLRVGDVNHFGECPTLRGASCARRNIFQSAHFRKCNVTKVGIGSCRCSVLRTLESLKIIDFNMFLLHIFQLQEKDNFDPMLCYHSSRT